MKEIANAFTILLIVIMVVDVSIIIVTLCNSGIMNLDGIVGKIDHDDIWSHLDPISAFFYRIGDLTCHQMTSRSIIIGGSQMPICIRDTMLIFGTTMGCVIVIRLEDRIDKNVTKYCIIGILLAALTIIEYFIKGNTGIDILSITGFTAVISGIGTIIVMYCATYCAVHIFFKE